MRFIVVTVFLALSFLFGKSVAFLVDSGSATRLPQCEKDIQTMKKLLGDKYEYIILQGKEATSKNIRKVFNRLSKELKSSDTLVFYYTGHGSRFNSGDANEEDSQDDFLATADITEGKRGVINVLIDNELNYLYSKIKARKIIIIDSCHSGTINKAASVLDSRYETKVYKSNTTYKRGFRVPKKWSKAKNRNFLHFAAAKENESAKVDKDRGGSVFTNTIEDIITQYGNISFAKLEELAQNNIKPTFDFTPNISKDSTIDKNTLYTKDIFVVATDNSSNSLTLEDFLNTKEKTITLMTQSRNNRFKLNRFLAIKAYLDKEPKHLYLLDLKDKNNYKLISAKKSCIFVPKKKRYMCQFKNLKATKPVGVSNLYLIATQQPLAIDGLNKDSIITQNFFEKKDALVDILKKSSFELGYMQIETIE